jgi:hypothetical protein
MNESKNIHLMLRQSGSIEKIEFYNFLMEKLDKDWPFKQFESKLCHVCGGGIWFSPRFNIDQLKLLARQVNELATLRGHFKIKIHCWGKDSKCWEILQKRLDSGDWHREGEKLVKGPREER